VITANDIEDDEVEDDGARVKKKLKKGASFLLFHRLMQGLRVRTRLKPDCCWESLRWLP
jgi:hypothetical protein